MFTLKPEVLEYFIKQFAESRRHAIKASIKFPNTAKNPLASPVWRWEKLLYILIWQAQQLTKSWVLDVTSHPVLSAGDGLFMSCNQSDEARSLRRKICCITLVESFS